MTTPYVAYEATADQTDYVVTFPFINRTHVKVKVNGVANQIQAWTNDSTIRLFSKSPAGALVEIERETPIDQQLVKFKDGAILNAADLNTAVMQVLYRQQEITAAYERSIRDALVRLAVDGGIGTVEGVDVLDKIAEELAERAVIDTFQQRVAEIDLNAGQILTQAQELIEKGVEIDGLNLRADGLEGLQTNLQSQADTIRSDLTTLTSLVDSLAGGDPGSGIATLIAAEEAARIAGDTALVDTISLLGAKSADNLAFIADLSKLKVSPTESFAQRFSALSAADGANTAAIATEETARIDAVAAEAARITLLDTRLGSAEASVAAETSARVAGDTAVASDVTALTTRVGAAEADILSEQTARSDADSAIAADVTTLLTRMGDAEAAVVAEQSARSSGDEAEATARLALASTVADNEAAILTEQNTRSTADSALAASLSALTVRVGGAESDILSEQTVRASQDNALASDISGLLTRMGSAEATIVTDRQARVDGDGAIATTIDALQTEVDDNVATVSTLAQSINGLEARYGVVLNVNGHITGFAQNNDGETGNFIVTADRFAIVDPNGGSPFVPFEISGGVVRIKAASIGTLAVDKLIDGTLGANVTQDGDWLVGNGRIIFDNGTFMKVSGTGFGTSGQFIEWFGPKRAISTCDEASAIQYLKTDGSAYFGGALSAGTISVSLKNTQLVTDPSISTGSFGSNGNTRNVVASFSSIRTTQHTNFSDDSSGTSSCKLRLLRGGTLLQEVTLTGTTSFEASNGPGEDGSWSENIAGSFTFADNSGGSLVNYTVEVVNRTLASPPSGQVGATTWNQSVSVVSTEQ